MNHRLCYRHAYHAAPLLATVNLLLRSNSDSDQIEQPHVVSVSHNIVTRLASSGCAKDSEKSSVLALSPLLTYQNKRDRERRLRGWETHRRSPPNVYDFVVLGYGRAGRSALQILREQCPTAKIAVVDPWHNPSGPSDAVEENAKHRRNSHVQFWPNHALRLHPLTREVELHPGSSSSLSPPQPVTLQYKHAVLVATGSRGAPPPNYLIDEKVARQVYELRSTVLPGEDPSREVLSPAETRRRVLQLAASGRKVAILGCGWDALHLAVEISQIAYRKRARPVLMFGNFGPLCHVLPNYLSTAVAKRLKTKKIEILDRSLVRYITQDTTERMSDGLFRMLLYTAKSYDLLETHRTSVDAMVIAPEVSGPRGSAAVATADFPSHLEESSAGRSWYQTWAHLTQTSPEGPFLMACYNDDGRIAVNQEFSACTGVYAAGSVAKMANGWTGNADVAGEGLHDGAGAGRMAGLNMARLFLAEATSLVPWGREAASLVERVYTKEPIPVWRSDLVSSGSVEKPTQTLSNVGITALCVGTCDSERFMTHGVWWTNLAAQRRLVDLIESDNEEPSTEFRMRKSKLGKREPVGPVYGIGVVYYLSRTGRIQGVMTWGLPFTTTDHQLNSALVQLMKEILLKQGNHGSLASEWDRSQYLATASRQLVATAWENHSGRMAAQPSPFEEGGAWENNFPRPLHRFTEVRPPSLRTLAVLKRKGGHGHGILGEDLFTRYEESPVEYQPPPPVSTEPAVGTASLVDSDLERWTEWEHHERQWDENESRARPPKEDPLWIRKGDDIRSVSSHDSLSTAYSRAIWTKGS